MQPKILSKSTCEDYKTDGEFRQRCSIDGKQYKTVAGKYWSNMRARCKIGGKFQSNSPTYVGVINGFESFESFARWAVNQIGYGSGALDKDIIKRGNKLYCEDYCAFVPLHVNGLISNNTAIRGGCPVGVSYCKNSKKFQAKLSVDGVLKHLGLFNDTHSSFLAYKTAKEAEIKRVANLYKDVLDKRVYDALQCWQVNEDD